MPANPAARREAARREAVPAETSRREAIRAEADFLRGVRLWRAHPWRRELADPPVLWREGPARLLDYGGEGPRVLFVPSLVNRWTVLDLMPGHSMLRWLAANGVRPLLLDWGEAEPGFTLTDHIAGRLTRALEAAGGKTILAGYCMGGTFAVAAAALRPDLVAGLVLLATPWDFHAGGDDGTRRQKLALARSLLTRSQTGLTQTGLTQTGLARASSQPPLVSVETLQTLFALEDAEGIAEKFRRFAALDPDGFPARLFVALEDWLNDGVPLSGAVALGCLEEWYEDNLPMRGLWRVAGLTIDPAALAVPALVAVPRRDRIVPPDQALPLARLLPNATLLRPESGHVGMVAGSAAPTALWGPLRDWLLTMT